MGNYYGTDFQRQQKRRMFTTMLVSIVMILIVAYEGWRIHADIAYVLLVMGVFAAWFALALFSYFLAARKLRALTNAEENESSV